MTIINCDQQLKEQDSILPSTAKLITTTFTTIKSVPKSGKEVCLALFKRMKSPQGIGLFSLIAVISLWLTSSMLTKDMLKYYDKPVLMTFASVTSMQLYFIFLKVKDPLKRYMDLKTARIGLSLFLFYSLGLYFVHVSYKYTTLGSAAILGSTSSFFTLFLGSFLNVETFTIMKGAAVVVTFLGVVVESLPNVFKKSSGAAVLTASVPFTQSQNWGNLLSLLGAICYASFIVLLQKQTVNKNGLNRPLLFAFIGFFTMIFCWPVLLYLQLSGNERLELPQKAVIYVFLVLKIVLGSIIPTYLWNVTFALTSPLYIAVGTSLTIPLNYVADYFMGNKLSWTSAIGASIVTIGCLIMNLAEI